MHRWACIGTGDISERVAADIAAESPGSLVAVWGRTRERAQRFAHTYGIGFATDSMSDVLTRDDVDIVYIATPAHTHAEIAIEALTAGKHVLVEKPLATNAADTRRVLNAAHASGRFAMEAMWTRFNPVHVEVRARIADGLLGEISGVRASFGTPFRARGRVLTPAQGGSILRDRGIYPVTLAHGYLGTPVRIHAVGAFMDGVDISGHSTFDYERGIAQLAWSGVQFLDLSATVSGERGWVTFDPMFWAGSSARVHAGSAERIFGEPEVIHYPREGNGYRPMVAGVRSALDDGLLEHPWHTHCDTIAIAETLDAVMAGMTADIAEDNPLD
ncbi:Gfo/Idh/MocA family oxidoreductase [Microbacterium sp. Marseille-Q6648]|uniref:Gfo/Idh/MocA family protein n=1 Tax=Microbacterium sp. Marseille-Q6648 TaxID=2937991 RepID=UPI002041CD9F|nr:Gfo/Idh/MocA family oxidoreductase [Microbacterium sp. Marseille-Q6648]